jgi:predicted transcriptional regulator YdeE
MNKTITELGEMKLVGITVRTNNIAEMNHERAKISRCVQLYFQHQLAAKISHRMKPEITLCAYTEYESDFNGDYTYFIGEEVSRFENIPEEFSTLTIPPQTYAKLTPHAGPMPNVLIDAWHSIWKMTPSDFGAPRRYHTDFELYDERARDHTKAVLDIYIGLKNEQ